MVANAFPSSMLTSSMRLLFLFPGSDIPLPSPFFEFRPSVNCVDQMNARDTVLCHSEIKHSDLTTSDNFLWGSYLLKKSPWNWDGGTHLNNQDEFHVSLGNKWDLYLRKKEEEHGSALCNLCVNLTQAGVIRGRSLSWGNAPWNPAVRHFLN